MRGSPAQGSFASLPPRVSPPYNWRMAEREPALLRDGAAASDADRNNSTIPGMPPGPAPAPPAGTTRAPATRSGEPVYVVGFWKRLLAGLIDLGVILPAALLITVIAGK